MEHLSVKNLSQAKKHGMAIGKNDTIKRNTAIFDKLPIHVWHLWSCCTL